VVLSNLSDLEEYVEQNSEAEIQRRREIRIALRALDGQRVYWPYLHIHVSPRYFKPGRTLTVTDYGHEEFVVFPWYAVQGTSFNVL
jgi:hypothetical protein